MPSHQSKDEFERLLHPVIEPDTEVTKLMQQVGVRSHNAEKMAWTAAHLMRKRPCERQAHTVVIETLHDYVSNTALLVQRVRMLTLGQYDQEETDV